jgi:hypothetical protein|tara:strand:- start:652 stop:1206 length:555 start_codon:yes stop_codon:yes gene_type:complete
MTQENVWDCQLILKQNNYVYLFNVNNHKKIKNKILKEIDNTPSKKIQGVYKTDWQTDPLLKRMYWENHVKFLADKCIEYLKKDLYKYVKQDTWHHNHWFHQYEKNYGFGWHTHGESNFSGIYYVSLKDSKYKTQFIDFNLPIKEGNLLIFPSFLLHCSPLINSKTKKTIVSFNFSITTFYENNR